MHVPGFGVSYIDIATSDRFMQERIQNSMQRFHFLVLYYPGPKRSSHDK
jgi:hypothetical protein